MRFVKGHGTGNDFVLLPDPDGRLEVSAALVAAICDRRTGIGADGVLRVVRSASAQVAAGFHPVSAGPDAEWFMDYRNADGSLAEMCGNGVRVFARYLLDEGLVAGPEVAIATRAGVRTVRRTPVGAFTAEMGPARVLGPSNVLVGGRPVGGLAISVGNPHLACVVDEPLAVFDLTDPPELDRYRFPDGANVELVRLVGPQHAEMAVHERGSGLTQSCGTGAVAAAVAAAAASGDWPAPTPPEWTIDVAGGRLVVTPSEDGCLLTGPAVIVAEGVLSQSWLASRQAQ